MRKKQVAPKKNGSRPRPAPQPKKSNSRLESSTHVWTPLARAGLMGGKAVITAKRDAPLLGDPFVESMKTQLLRKQDQSTMILNAEHCGTLEGYSDKDKAGLLRINWVVPLLIKEADQGQTTGKTIFDSRGVFGDIGPTTITFENMLPVKIKVVINSPRARIDDVGKPYLRVAKRELEIKPRGKMNFHVTYGDKANIFTPLQTYAAEDETASTKKVPCFAVADFVVLYPKSNIMSGQAFDKTSEVCGVTLRQKYLVTGAYEGTALNKERIPYIVSKLKTYEDIFVENPYNITGKMVMSGTHTVTKVGPLNLVCRDGNPVQMACSEGALLTIEGCHGYFRVIGGSAVLWDVALEAPDSGPIDSPIVIPHGAALKELPLPPLEIDLGDVIAWLTTLTKILTVVSAFL